MAKQTKAQKEREERNAKDKTVAGLAAIDVGDGREVRIVVKSFDDGQPKVSVVERKKLKGGGFSERQLNRVPCAYLAMPAFLKAYTGALIKGSEHATQPLAKTG